MARSEYPRPEFTRSQWMPLNGTWEFQFEEEEWGRIEIPFVFQSKASGIGENRLCSDIAYRRNFTVPREWQGQMVFLHFGAVDYRAKVYINGCLAGEHEGSSAPFRLNVTELLSWGEETVQVLVNDPCDDEEIPRGKQYWKPVPESIWYTPSSGIWQSVWLEPVAPCHLSALKFTPNVDDGTVDIAYEVAGLVEEGRLRVQIFFAQSTVCDLEMLVSHPKGHITVDVFQNHIFNSPVHHAGRCWSPEHPNLFQVTATLTSSGYSDTVSSYFGMRKIEQRDGMVWLNNKPYYQRLVLDQGYWPDSLLTAPSDDAFRQDILLAKQMGFNGCRKHQKAEDPRFLYWADHLGFLVWSEIPSCPSYSPKAGQRVMREWEEIIQRDYNHPSIVCWVVLNESWGVPMIRSDKKQQSHSLALYYNVYSMDDTRLVVNNDGWEMTVTDICAVHNYRHGDKNDTPTHDSYRKEMESLGAILSSSPAGRPLYAHGYSYSGEPVLLTEFGGIAFCKTGADSAWGYTVIENEEEFVREYGRLLGAIDASTALFGYCYTQLTDVEQEINGLLTVDRKFKVSPEAIAMINAATGRRGSSME